MKSVVLHKIRLNSSEWSQRQLTLTHTLKLLLATYFGELRDNLQLASSLPVAGLHVDVARTQEEIPQVLESLGAEKVLSLGVITQCLQEESSTDILKPSSNSKTPTWV